MDLSALLLLIGVLACPIGMGVMMWLMNRQVGDQHAMPGHQNTPATAAERLNALHAQRQALEAEIAEVAKLAELETRRKALLAVEKSGSAAQEDASSASEAPNAAS